MYFSKVDIRGELEEAYPPKIETVRNVILCFYKIVRFFENPKIRNYKKLFTIALTIPISWATCERSFSEMKKIKIWPKTLLVQDRFSDLSILCIEKYKKLRYFEYLCRYK
jgi:hypothetical protein